MWWCALACQTPEEEKPPPSDVPQDGLERNCDGMCDLDADGDGALAGVAADPNCQ